MRLLLALAMADHVFIKEVFFLFFFFKEEIAIQENEHSQEFSLSVSPIWFLP